MIGRTLILGGGETDYSFAETYLEGQKFDSVVCADSGLAAAKKLGLDVSFFMGDFDSVDKEVLAEYMEMDHQIAVMERLRRKARRKEECRQGIRKNLIYQAACMFGLARQKTVGIHKKEWRD